MAYVGTIGALSSTLGIYIFKASALPTPPQYGLPSNTTALITSGSQQRLAHSPTPPRGCFRRRQPADRSRTQLAGIWCGVCFGADPPAAAVATAVPDEGAVAAALHLNHLVLDRTLARPAHPHLPGQPAVRTLPPEAVLPSESAHCPCDREETRCRKYCWAWLSFDWPRDRVIAGQVGHP